MHPHAEASIFAKKETRSPYYLSQLQHKIIFELGRDHFLSSTFTVPAYAKLLVQIGLYSDAIGELQKCGFIVEALHLAIALNELGVLRTCED